VDSVSPATKKTKRKRDCQNLPLKIQGGLYQLFQMIVADNSSMYEGYSESNLRWDVNKTRKEKKIIIYQKYVNP
jgi:hypothetical protein